MNLLLMDNSQPEFVARVAGLLGCFYLVASGANLGATVYWFRKRQSWIATLVWLGLSCLFAAAGAAALMGRPPAMPEVAKAAIDAVLGR